MILAALLVVPFDLQGAIDTALRAGRTSLVLPKGEIRLSATGAFALDVKGINGFEISGPGTTLILTRPNLGLAAFRYSRRITLKGFTVRHEPVTQTQGWVRSVNNDKSIYEVEMMPGYEADPAHLPDNPVAYIFDPQTLNWRKGSIDLDFKRVVSLGNRRLKLEVGRPMNHDVRVGDYMAFRGRGQTDVLLDNCADSRIEDVTFQSASGFVVHESGGDGGNYFRYNVLRGPKPTGATIAPLLSANADAFHSSGVRKGPIVENSRFEYMPDDGVPIHGNYVGVSEASGKRLVITAQWAEEWFRKGDRIRVYTKDGVELRTKGELPKVVEFKPLAGYKGPSLAYDSLKDKPHNYEVWLDKEVPGAQLNDLASNAERQGDGFVVRGNSILNNRARGMLLTASNGLVENNRIDGSTIGGIVLAPELYWMQSDFSSNVVIRNNTVRNIGYATVGPWTNQVGGIVVTADKAKANLHQNIRIQDNLLETIYGPAIVVRFTSQAIIQNNQFRNLQSVINGAGSNHGIPAKGEIFRDEIGR